MTALPPDYPTHTPLGATRRTLNLLDQLDAARSASCQVILTGKAVHDVLIDEQGRPLYLPLLVRSYCEARGLGLVTYRRGAGVATQPTLPGGGSVHVSTARGEDEAPVVSIRQALADLRAADTPAVLLIDYADLLLPDEPIGDPDGTLLTEIVQELSADTLFWQNRGLQVVLVDRGAGVLRRLTGQPGYRTITVDPPDSTETGIYLVQKCGHTARQRLHLAPDLTVDEASRISGGLLLRNIGETAATSSPSDPVSALDLSRLKGDSIRQQSSGALDLLTDTVTFQADVAGMYALQLLLQDARAVGDPTVRLILAGPPGTGKTYSACAIASLLGVPLVSFGQILGELLGQAENNMRQALAILLAMAPVILFIDEADQGALGDRGAGARNAHEAHMALRAMLFEFLGDTGASSGVSVILTTNVPTRLDPRARSRFEVVPTLFASGSELVDVVTIYGKRASIPIGEDLGPLLTGYVDGGQVLSGRSAQRLLKKAWRLARRHDEPHVTVASMETALREWHGNDWDAAAEYSTLSAIDAVDDIDVLPWIAARHLGKEYPVPPNLGAYIDADGRPKRDEIQGTLRTLEATGVW